MDLTDQRKKNKVDDESSEDDLPIELKLKIVEMAPPNLVWLMVKDSQQYQHVFSPALVPWETDFCKKRIDGLCVIGSSLGWILIEVNSVFSLYTPFSLIRIPVPDFRITTRCVFVEEGYDVPCLNFYGNFRGPYRIDYKNFFIKKMALSCRPTSLRDKNWKMGCIVDLRFLSDIRKGIGICVTYGGSPNWTLFQSVNRKPLHDLIYHRGFFIAIDAAKDLLLFSFGIDVLKVPWARMSVVRFHRIIESNSRHSLVEVNQELFIITRQIQLVDKCSNMYKTVGFTVERITNLFGGDPGLELVKNFGNFSVFLGRNSAIVVGSEDGYPKMKRGGYIYFSDCHEYYHPEGEHMVNSDNRFSDMGVFDTSDGSIEAMHLPPHLLLLSHFGCSQNWYPPIWATQRLRQ